MKLGTKEIPALRLGADAALKAYLGGSQVWPLGFDPASLFAQGEQGVWYDPSDFSTMFQDAEGTTPVTAVEQPVGRILDKSGRGFHATQATATSRPVLRQDGSGKHYLYFDGVDDYLVTPTITPGIDKVQVFAGVRKLSGSSGTIAELSGNFNNNAGTFWLSSSTEFQFSNHLQGYSGFKTSALATTFTGVLAIVSDLSLPGAGGGEVPTLRLNGASDRAEASFISPDNTGTFGNYPLYIGRRGGTTLPFNGHLYSLAVRFGSNLAIEAIEQVEAWINGKTGAY